VSYVSYVDVPTFRAKTILAAELVIAIDGANPNFLLGCLTDWSAWLDAQLRKRYAVPFVAPIPLIVPRWVVRLAGPDVYRKRYIDPQTDQLLDALTTDRTDAKTEIQQAADAVDGLFDLPLLDTATASAVTQGLPLSSADQNPYDWIDRQAILNGRRVF
jgi:hypothetical protein